MKEQGIKLRQWWNGLSGREKYTIKGILAVCIWMFAISFFLINKGQFYGLDGSGNNVLLKKKVLFYFVSIVIDTAGLLFKNPLSPAGNKVLNFHVMEWFPLVCFIMVETILGANIIKMNFYRTLYNILLYMLVMYLFYAITASVKAATIGLAVFSALFTIVNVYLVEFRQIPLLASDLTVIKTAANVAGDFQYTLNADVIVMICFVIAVIVFSSKLKQDKPSRRHRVFALAVYLCFLTQMLHLTVFTDTLRTLKIGINTFRPLKSYGINGGLLTFTRSIRLMMVDKPENYSTGNAQDIAADYTSDSVDDDSFMEPNVIVIMNEAFADLQSVGNFETNEEVLPFYNSLEEDTVKGFAYVSVFGGQTANSEFEFLTGDTKAFLPSGATPYQLYIKKYVPSLTGNLKFDQYQGLLALHPFQSSGYNRVNVYQNFGFSQFITRDDFVNPKMVRQFISDESDYDRIIEEYEAAKKQSDAPFYAFTVTMQNHSSYDTDYDNLPDTIQIITPECQNESAQRYLNLIHLSDAATEQLVNYFRQQDEPTVIVMFGDHEPGLSNAFYESIMGKNQSDMTDEESMELYKVPFFIWANYDIEERYIEKTSLNYLQSIMLEAAGMKLTGYNKYLLSLMEDVPAINVSGYFGQDGVYYDVKDENSPYYDRLKEYNILEYNHLFDSRRMDVFFELQQ